MAVVYILQRIASGKYYIGSTQDFEKRFKDHLRGKVYTTKRMLPLQVVFEQTFPDMKQAMSIEKKLKGFKRRDFIEKIVRDGVIKKLI